MVSATAIRQLREANNEIARRIVDDLTGLFQSLNLADPYLSRDALLEVLPALTDQYGEIATAIAAEWYDDIRATERVPGSFRARPAPLAPPDQVQGSVRYFAGALFTDTPEALLVPLGGALVRHVLDPARETVRANTVRDPRAVGWQRIARADGCDFCVMLAQRGAVYKRGTATFAAHDDCRCTCTTSWDPDAPEVSVEAYAASERLEAVRRRAAAGDASAQRRLQRHNETTRNWINNYQDVLDDYRQDAGL